jgi:hypothetical protein
MDMLSVHVDINIHILLLLFGFGLMHVQGERQYKDQRTPSCLISILGTLRNRNKSMDRDTDLD